MLSGWLVTGPLILFARQESVTVDLVGQLALPMQLCAVLSGLMLSASIAAVPVLSRSIARGDGKELHFLWGVVGGAMLIGGIVSLLGAFAGLWVVRLAFGDGFRVAGGLLGPALALLIPLTVGNAAVQVLIARELMLKIIGSAVLGAAALSANLPWLVAREGPAGAIAAAGIGATLWAATSLAFAHLAGRAARAPGGSAT
jgi:O-antigen/teichoic acid export membrane protein